MAVEKIDTRVPVLATVAVARRAAGWRMSHNLTGMIGLALLLLVIGAAISAPLLAPGGFAEQDFSQAMRPPFWLPAGSTAHPFGTDPLGRDILSRMLWAADVSLGIAAVSVVIAMSLGVLLGLLAGYYGGVLDGLVMRVADVQLSFPYILLAIAVMALLEPSLLNLVLLLALPGWMVYARTVRASVLGLKRREFIEAARALGASDRRLIFNHLAPNVLAPVIVLSSFQIAQVIVAEASLSFLGVGVQPPIPSWGAMLNQGREYLSSAWWLGIFPGLAIVITVVGTNLFGDGLRDALDPRLKF